MSNHPIIPSSELINQWETLYFDEGENLDIVLIQAYQAGADQELEACKQVIMERQWFVAPGFRLDQLHNARRPKPPSLKQHALSELDSLENMGACNADIIRRALEQLPDK